jgi:hypothetical protein
MQRDGIMPSIVEDAITVGTKVLGADPGTFIYGTAGVRVVVGESGEVITVMPGK